HLAVNLVNITLRISLLAGCALTRKALCVSTMLTPIQTFRRDGARLKVGIVIALNRGHTEPFHCQTLCTINPLDACPSTRLDQLSCFNFDGLSGSSRFGNTGCLSLGQLCAYLQQQLLVQLRELYATT